MFSNKNIFETITNNINNKVIEPGSILGNARVIFVADAFSDTYTGGAELSTEALRSAVPEGIEVAQILSSNISAELLAAGQDRFWVFFNCATMDWNFIPMIVANLEYAVVEYDYKFCRWRSIDKHRSVEGVDCDCHEQIHGKLYSSLLYGAKHIFWMSEEQYSIYCARFPFLKDVQTTILSSVFDDQFFVKVKELRATRILEGYKDRWIVMASPSWIKGRDQALKVCSERGYTPYEVWDLPYDQMIQIMAQSRGLVFHPQGADTCPRLVIEAKLLGLELDLNNNVQHKNEEWFATDDLESIESYLYAARNVFWSSIIHHMSWKPTISGYTTTYNCILQEYPYIDSIKSMLEFCDEVIVVDGGSTDGTYEQLKKLENENAKLKVSLIERDWNSIRHAVFDGQQKAEARKLCTKEFCWQQDADEIVLTKDIEKIINLCKNWPKFFDLIALPVAEYWGSKNKLRLDINPWKWRLSKNKENITHGIPIQLRKYDENGFMYALPGTDGCDYIDMETGHPIPFIGFVDEKILNLRNYVLNANDWDSDNHKLATQIYKDWFKNVINNLPAVRHYSWFNIERKIKTYKNYWSKHWQSLYNIEQIDSVENNMFFDKKWIDVTDEDIKNLAIELSNKTGGHIFHTKINWSKPMPCLDIEE